MREFSFVHVPFDSIQFNSIQFIHSFIHSKTHESMSHFLEGPGRATRKVSVKYGQAGITGGNAEKTYIMPIDPRVRYREGRNRVSMHGASNTQGHPFLDPSMKTSGLYGDEGHPMRLLD